MWRRRQTGTSRIRYAWSSGWSAAAKLGYFTAMSVAYFTAYTVFSVPYASLTYEVAPEHHEALLRLTRFREFP